MKIKLCILISLFFVLSESISQRRFSKNPSRIVSIFKQSMWKGSVDGFTDSSRAAAEILMRYKIYGKLDYSFSEKLDFQVEMRFGQSKGQKQSLFFKEFEDDPLKSLYVKWNFTPQINIRGGSISQSFLNAPLMISENWGFLGVMGEYLLNPFPVFSWFNIDSAKIVLQQALPSSRTEKDLFGDLQNTARFWTASAFMETLYKDRFQITSRLTGYVFNNLHSSVAEFGRERNLNEAEPNTIGPYAQFKYPFYGYDLGARVRFNLFHNLDVELKTDVLWNMGAKEHGWGRSLVLGLYIQTSPNLVLVPSLEHFFNEKNAAPAYYNEPRYGHSNKNGWILGLKSLFDKYNFYMNLQYGVIRSEEPFKSTEGHSNYIQLSIGTNYEAI